MDLIYKISRVHRDKMCWSPLLKLKFLKIKVPLIYYTTMVTSKTSNKNLENKIKYIIYTST